MPVGIAPASDPADALEGNGEHTSSISWRAGSEREHARMLEMIAASAHSRVFLRLVLRLVEEHLAELARIGTLLCTAARVPAAARP